MIKDQESFYKGVMFMLVSATGLAFVGLLGKLGGEEFTLSSLIFWRFIASVLICLLVLWVRGRIPGKIGFVDWKMNLIRSACVLSAQYSFFYYIQHESLLNGMVLLNTGPLFIPLIEWGILRNRVGKSSWISVFVSFLGVLCILQPDKGIFSVVSFVGLLAGLSQGASQVVFGIASKKENVDLSVLELFWFCAVFSLVPYLSMGSTWIENFTWDATSISLIVALGIASVSNQTFRAAAYREGTPSRLASFLYFAVILAGLFDWWVFGHIPNKLSIAGTVLVLLGGFLKIWLRKKFTQKHKAI